MVVDYFVIDYLPTLNNWSGANVRLAQAEKEVPPSNLIDFTSSHALCKQNHLAPIRAPPAPSRQRESPLSHSG